MVAFLGILRKHRYLWTTASVISLCLHRYLHIFPIHFHINHSKSYCCSQVYIIIEIDISYYLNFTLFYIDLKPCILIMQTDTTPNSQPNYYLTAGNSQTGWIVGQDSQITIVEASNSKIVEFAYQRHDTCWLHFKFTSY